jgi:hypothetical protein
MNGRRADREARGSRARLHRLQAADRDFPKGQQIVWAGDDTLLDVSTAAPATRTQPWGPRSGITYFHYWRVKQRFFSRSLYDAGRGPQRTRNKRISQIDEIIDRGLPKVFVEEGSIDEDELTGTPSSWSKSSRAPRCPARRRDRAGRVDEGRRRARRPEHPEGARHQRHRPRPRPPASPPTRRWR